MKGGSFMNERRLIAVMIVCAAIVAGLLFSTRPMSAQNNQSGSGDREEPPPPFYNPYPFGILPADLNSEIARVVREVDNIEAEALGQLRALAPPTLTGQPPTLANTGQRANVLLGKVMNFDRNMSPFKNRACGFCHMPLPALADRFHPSI
jgi:cytochrome c peroxidase